MYLLQIERQNKDCIAPQHNLPHLYLKYTYYFSINSPHIWIETKLKTTKIGLEQRREQYKCNLLL